MNIFRGLDSYNIENTFLTIGTFDGLHLGHQKLINRLIELAKAKKANTTLLTFWPHPKLVLSKNNSDLKLLNSIYERIDLVKKMGIDNLIIYPFTEEFSKLSANNFIEEILIEKIKIKALVIGYDHHFGHQREGEIDSISAKAKKYDFYLEQVKVFTQKNINISSTKIRNALAAGNIELAKKYLSYNYMLSGRVIHGKKIGRNIGFPTANVEIDEKYKLIPAKGVYAVQVVIENATHFGMMNIGSKPTVNSATENLSLEVNLFDFNENIYGKKIKIILLTKIRDERKFANLEGLKAQIEKDKQQILLMGLT